MCASGAVRPLLAAARASLASSSRLLERKLQWARPWGEGPLSGQHIRGECVWTVRLEWCLERCLEWCLERRLEQCLVCVCVRLEQGLECAC